MKLSQPSCALQPPSRVINYAVKVYKRTMGTRTYSSRVGKIVSLPPCEASTRFVGCCCCCSLSTVTSLSTSRKSGILILLQQIDFCLPVWRASHGHDFFHSGQCIFFFPLHPFVYFKQWHEEEETIFCRRWRIECRCTERAYNTVFSSLPESG